MNICMVSGFLASIVWDYSKITNLWRYIIKLSTVLIMVKINNQDCTCCGHHTKCLLMSNNVYLCGDCQYNIYKGIYYKSNRFPNNPPAVMVNKCCMHCNYEELCLEVLDNYFLCDACMYEQVRHDEIFISCLIYRITYFACYIQCIICTLYLVLIRFQIYNFLSNILIHESTE